jgi:hypothetical protein
LEVQVEASPGAFITESYKRPWYLQKILPGVIKEQK